VETVATDGTGADELWSAIEAHRVTATASGELDRRRVARAEDELREVVVARLREQALDRCTGERWTAALDRIRRREADPWTVVDELLD
jgi:LAO/AO transport system kinase